MRITNFEMETSAIYGMARLMGHEALSLNAIVANRVLKEFSKNGHKAVEKLINEIKNINDKGSTSNDFEFWIAPSKVDSRT